MLVRTRIKPACWLGTLEVILYTLINLIHIIICPFNKVEESFNTQAIYDIINTPLFLTNSSSQDSQRWDHEDFPGVVPRTFIGALTVGSIAKTLKIIISQLIQSHSQLYMQIASRIILACLMTVSLCYLTRSIQRRYQLKTRILFDLFMVTQFHYMFYSSRFLPNTFAAILTNFAIASWLDSEERILIPCVATSVLVFRFDSSLFYGWIILVGLIFRKNISFRQLLTLGLSSGISALFATTIIDSYLWNRLLWPEGEGIYFNVWLNKSHEWGTLPYFWYFYSCLPRLTMTGLLYVSFASRFSVKNLLFPALAFIATYSILPHKELRFIIYIVPVLNIVAADGLTNFDWLLVNYKYSTSETHGIKENRKENPVYLLLLWLRLLTKLRIRRPRSKPSLTKLMPVNRKALGCLFNTVIFLTFIANSIFTIIFLTASSYNYPGGHGSLWLHKNLEVIKVIEGLDDNLKINVYAGNLAAQTGLTRFLQLNNVCYNKDAHFDIDKILSENYITTFLMLEPEEASRFETDFCEGQELSKDHELSCHDETRHPRYCSIVHTEMMFDNVSIDFRKLIHSAASMSMRTDYLIRTKQALRIIRCGLTSKFNPFL